MLKMRAVFQMSCPLLLLLLLLLLTTNTAKAQFSKDVVKNLTIPDSSHIQVIVMQDKSTLIGRIVRIKKQEILFKTEFGEITIPIRKIKRIEMAPKSSIKKGKYWFPNPNATRLFIGNTGRMLKKGDGYFADSYLLFPSVAYGITNNISIGGGMSLIPGLDPDKQIFYFSPRIGVTATKKLNLAVGALVIKVPNWGDDDDSPLVGVVNATATYGSTNSSVTLALGYGFVDDEFASRPMVLIGGEHRISRRIALVSENWLLPSIDEPLISYGMRFFGEKISVDLALLNVLSDQMIFPGFPYVDFVFNF